MKKIIPAVLVFALVSALFTAAVSAATQVDQTNDDIQISISRAAVAPVIDGKLDEDSYQRIDIKHGDLNLNSNSLDLTTIAFDAYISYDDNNVYILLSGDERYHYCDHSPGSGDIWNQSCIQISLAANNTIAMGGDRLEIGLARNNDGEMCTYIWSQGYDSNGAVEFEFAEGQNFMIANDGGRLNYEVAVPWNTFVQGKPGVGDKFGFNFMYVWSADDIDVREKLEFSSGCDVSGKNADLFAQVTVTDNVLQAAPVVVEEPEPEPEPEELGAGGGDPADIPAPVVEAPPAAPAPVTADPISLIVLGAVISVAGAAIARKRK